MSLNQTLPCAVNINFNSIKIMPIVLLCYVSYQVNHLFKSKNISTPRYKLPSHFQYLLRVIRMMYPITDEIYQQYFYSAIDVFGSVKTKLLYANIVLSCRQFTQRNSTYSYQLTCQYEPLKNKGICSDAHKLLCLDFYEHSTYSILRVYIKRKCAIFLNLSLFFYGGIGNIKKNSLNIEKHSKHEHD